MQLINMQRISSKPYLGTDEMVRHHPVSQLVLQLKIL